MYLSMPSPINIEGLRVGWLVAIAPTEKRYHGQIVWLCKCDCGNVVEHGAVIFRTQSVTSCGCMTLTLHSRPNLKNRTHGKTDTRLYHIWTGMKNRCHTPSSSSYKWYGARGISVCEDWRNSFEAFERDMLEGYASDLTIERKEVNKNYNKDNCIWIPMHEQAMNTRMVTHIDTPWGPLSPAAAARKVGVDRQTLVDRIAKGWTYEKIFSPPSDIKIRARNARRARKITQDR